MFGHVEIGKSPMLPTDARLTAHQRRVFAFVAAIPAGKVSTYGLVAIATGSCARAVGQAMRRNPLAPAVP